MFEKKVHGLILTQVFVGFLVWTFSMWDFFYPNPRRSRPGSMGWTKL